MSNTLEHKIRQYKRKFFLNLSLRGFLISATILLSIFLFYALLEYQTFFNSTVRTVLFYSYMAIALLVFVKLILINVLGVINADHRLSDEKAANEIGSTFPEIKDKLLNLVQLKSSYSSENQLLIASINQRTKSVEHIHFSDAIDYRENLRYLKYLMIPFLIVLIIGILAPNVITEPAKRIIQHKTDFSPKAPFTFNLQNEELLAFKNEDFTIDVSLTGESIPSEVFLEYGERRIKLNKSSAGKYTYTFEKIQNDLEFNYAAAGFSSGDFHIKVVNRPNIKNFEVELNYPNYLNKSVERLSNVGNFQIPEGTQVKWYFETRNTNGFVIDFSNSEEDNESLNSDNQLFTFEKQLFSSCMYSLKLNNEYSANKDLIRYNIDVIKDQYPKIDLQQHRDTVLYNLIVLGGQVSDDYGLRGLNLHYKVADEAEKYQTVPVSIDRSKKQQSFFFQWELDTFKISSGESLEYFLSVTDNDGINGSKTTKTSVYTFKMPEKKEIREKIEKASNSAENQMDKNLSEAKKLKEELSKAEDRLKGKKNLSWQDEKMLEEIIDQKQKLEEEIHKLKEQFENLSEMQKQFQKEENERIGEKMKQLQELMDELLDEETKKMYEELQKLLEEKSNFNEIKNIVEDLNQKEFNLEKELERSLELFKRLKYDQKLEESIEQLEDISEEQKQLNEETQDKKSESEKLSEKQEEIKREMEEFEKSMEDVNELNQELKNPNQPADVQQEMQEINESINESLENLKKNKKNKANKAQQNAQQKMQKMAEKLKQMQGSSAMMSMQANLGDLREILENLIKLSFEQEKIMEGFRSVNQSDPKFLDLSQDQLNIQDDAKIIEDSLLSLANRVFQIKSFVTREVGDMNKNIDEAVESIKERKKELAVGKQQYAMTSMNNLALMLDDVLSQMQQAMADMMGNSKGDQNQQGKAPSLSELQQQLNQQIQQLKKSGKQGRQLSEELAKMAAEQEKIRQMLKEMQDKMNPLQEGEKPGSNLNDVMKKMEETETDLVNKRITEETIKRQQEIVTRLLEAEKSQREREKSQEREAEQANKYQKQIPKEFEEYLKNKEKEVELLKTVPPKLNQYYKEEVNKYFNRLGNF